MFTELKIHNFLIVFQKYHITNPTPCTSKRISNDWLIWSESTRSIKCEIRDHSLEWQRKSTHFTHPLDYMARVFFKSTNMAKVRLRNKSPHCVTIGYYKDFAAGHNPRSIDHFQGGFSPDQNVKTFTS